MISLIDELHPSVLGLIEMARHRGWLSYEEVNNTIPDEMVDPTRIDELLVILDAVGIEVVDELDQIGRAHV